MHVDIIKEQHVDYKVSFVSAEMVIRELTGTAKIIFFCSFAACVVLFQSLGLCKAVNIHCVYSYSNFDAVGRVYQCYVQNNLNINSQQNAAIASVAGRHESGKGNDDVIGFFAYAKNIQIFPRGLEMKFKNLKAITIGYGRVNEIHQYDLQPFPKLVYLGL